MRDKLNEIFGIGNLLPTHQGRACEHIIAHHFVKPGSCVIMNYHFTTSKAHVTHIGGHVEELVIDEGLITKSIYPSKGNIDLNKLTTCIEKEGAQNVAYLRLEAGTNLIGSQRFTHEPKTLRFFTGKLETVSDWAEKLLEAYRADFGDDQ